MNKKEAAKLSLFSALKSSCRRIAILGTPVSSGNRGVRALANSLVNLCAGKDGTNEVILMVGNRKSDRIPVKIGEQVRHIQVVNYRLSPHAKLREHLIWILLASLLYRFLPVNVFRKTLIRSTPWIEALVHSDVVGDVRGGDSFSDIYGMERFLVGFLEELTVLLVKGGIVQFPQTFGPYKNPISKLLARYLLKHSTAIIARDKVSREVAINLTGREREVLLCPDVAFSLSVSEPRNLKVFPELEGAVREGMIGININGLMYSGGYTRDNMFGLSMDYRTFLPHLIERLLLEHSGELWLVPHTYGPATSPESDPGACKRVREALPERIKDRVRIVVGEYDCHEIKGIIGMFDFFIGSRMHACIAALSQGIPCVGIAYSRKFKGVFDIVGVGEWVVDGRSVGNEEALSHVLHLYKQRHNVRYVLQERVKEAKTKIEDTFDRLLNL